MTQEQADIASLDGLRRENDELRARLADLDFLAEMVARLDDHASLDELQAEILNRLADRLGADVASLMILEPNSGELRIRAARGLTEEVIRDVRVKLGGAICGRVAASGRGLVAENVEELFGRANRPQYRTRSCLSAPLKFRGRIVGVLNFADKREGEFRSEDLETISRLGSHAAGLLLSAMSHEVLVQQERYERELQFAHTLQGAFLPGRPPECEGLQLAARYIPALEVGGDFYDFLPFPDGRLGLLVGDVSGKGVPAALFMARFSSAFCAVIQSGASPAEAMGRANEDVCRRSRRGLFVTAVYVVIDTANGGLTVSNAGHPVPLIRSASGEVRGVAEGINVPLGIVKGVEYPQAQLKLESGEKLLLVTDGTFEAKSPQGTRYGIDRLVEELSGADARPNVLIDHLLKDITRFRGGAARSDDLTIVCAGRP